MRVTSELPNSMNAPIIASSIHVAHAEAVFTTNAVVDPPRSASDPPPTTAPISEAIHPGSVKNRNTKPTTMPGA